MADCSNVSSECGESVDSAAECMQDKILLKNAQSDSRSESSDEDDDNDDANINGIKNNNFLMEMSMNN